MSRRAFVKTALFFSLVMAVTLLSFLPGNVHKVEAAPGDPCSFEFTQFFPEYSELEVGSYQTLWGNMPGCGWPSYAPGDVTIVWTAPDETTMATYAPISSALSQGSFLSSKLMTKTGVWKAKVVCDGPPVREAETEFLVYAGLRGNIFTSFANLAGKRVEKRLPKVKVEVDVGGTVETTYATEFGAYTFNKLGSAELGPGKTGILKVTLEDPGNGVNPYVRVFDGTTTIVSATRSFSFSDPGDLTQNLEFIDSPTITVTSVGPAKKPRLADYAVSYYYSETAALFAKKPQYLNMTLDLPTLPVQIYDFVPGSIQYYSPPLSEIFITNSNKATNANNPGKPDNIEFHEFSHYIMDDSLMGGDNNLPLGPNDWNHFGYANPDTADSLVEGFAEFMSSVMQDKMEGETTSASIYTLGSSGSFYDLEFDYKVWDVFGWQEELAVAGILWDLYDGPGNYAAGIDDDPVDLSLQDVWAVMNSSSGGNDRSDLKDIYDAFAASGKVSAANLDTIFKSHGAFHDVDADRAWDAGEVVGNAAHDWLFRTKWDINGDGSNTSTVSLGAGTGGALFDVDGDGDPDWGQWNLDPIGIIASDTPPGSDMMVFDADGDNDFGAIPNRNGDAGNGADMREHRMLIYPEADRRGTPGLPNSNIDYNAMDWQTGLPISEVLLKNTITYEAPYSHLNHTELGSLSLPEPAFYTVPPQGATGSLTAVKTAYRDSLPTELTSAQYISGIDTDSPSFMSQYFLMEQLPPVTTLETTPAAPDGDNGWFKTRPYVSLTADKTGATYYQWDSTSAPGWLTYTSSTETPAGEHALYYFSADTLGNTETVKSQLFKIDISAPTAPVLDGTATSSSRIDLSWTTAADDIGVTGYAVHETSTTGGTWPITETTMTFDGLFPGAYNYNVTARDAAGNTSAPSNALVFTLTSTAPPASAVTLHPSEQSMPAISGRRIVYQDTRNFNYDIYMYDLDTHIETRITTDPADQYSPAIDGDRIVWTDARWSPAGSDIYTYDVGTGIETRVTSDPADQNQPDVSGNHVVCTDNRSGNEDIFLYDLSSSAESQITTDGADQSMPALSGARVVWKDMRNGNADIFSYDISTTIESPLATDSADQWAPDISGDKATWIDLRNGAPDIYMRNLTDGLEYRITTNPGPQTNPAIFQGKIVWQDYRGGPPNIYGYDLTMDSNSDSVPNYKDPSRPDPDPAESVASPFPAAQMYPAIGSTVAWMDFRNGNADVFFIDDAAGGDTTPPTGSVSINSGAARTNTGAVTLSLDATDTNGSGVAWMSFSNDGVTWSARELYSTTKAWALSAGDGNRTVWARFIDSADNTSAAVSDTIFKDTAAPTATMTAPKFSTNVSKTKSFTVSWNGADAAPSSGIAGYDVQVKTNATGAWTTWKANTALKTAIYTGIAGNTYYFKARAKDNAANTGAYSAEAKTIVPYDNVSLITKRVGFTGVISKATSNYYLGTVRYSTTAGDELTYTFTGNYFALIGSKGPKFSKAVITIDGIAKTIEARAAANSFRQVLLEKALVLKKHTVKIKNLGTAGRTRFEVDGLGVGK